MVTPYTDELKSKTQHVVTMATQVVSSFMKQAAVQWLRTAAGYASSASVVLLATSEAAAEKCSNDGSRADLLECCRAAGQQVGELVAALRLCAEAPEETGRQLKLVTTAQTAVVVRATGRGMRLCIRARVCFDM